MTAYKTPLPATPCCVDCGQLFVVGVNVFTDDGIRETAITQTCERCFDGYFDDPDQDDEPYCICGNSPTEDEESSNTCASCGKVFS